MATKAEVLATLAYIAAGVQQPIAKLAKVEEERQLTIRVYTDALIDLPAEALDAAAKLVVLNHRYATFPSVAEIREAAVAATRGEVVEITAGEAWSLAWRAVANIDPDIEGSFQRQADKLPPIVLKALCTFGVRQLIAAENVDVARAHFLRIYGDLAAKSKQRALLPAKLATAIESGAASGNGAAKLPAVVEAAKRIGVEK